ncbi:FAD/NAD(P)-binding protein [Streptomyces hyaluromycini]|uniref:FAD/NAD(P)-binding protein n=1 Tax=Streptomyces hyaluromycini TaxID=1377993 RepID=UPI00142E8801|nr:FAD/NAD(P)-binding protein [Streptomyces hyaluromycini]
MGLTIGVVGSGTAGACLINNLAAQLEQDDASAPRPGQILVFDDTKLWWRGRAYQDDGEYIWCNSPMKAMSVVHHDPDHGQAWLRAHNLPLTDPDTGQPTFLTRPAYGDYLHSATRQTIGRLENQGWTVRLVSEHATRLENTPHGVRLYTKSERAVCDLMSVSSFQEECADRP